MTPAHPFEDAGIAERQVMVGGESKTVKDVVLDAHAMPISLARIQRVAKLYCSASPAMLEGTSRWEAAREQLRAAGLNAAERFQAWTVNEDRLYGVGGPDEAFMYGDAGDIPTRALHRFCIGVAARLDAGQRVPSQTHAAAATALRVLAERVGSLEEALWPLARLMGPAEGVTAVLAALPGPVAHRLLEPKLLPVKDGYIWLQRLAYIVRWQPFLSPRQLTRLEQSLERVAEVIPEFERVTLSRLREQFARGGGISLQERHGPLGVTDEVADSLAYLTEKYAEERMVERIGPMLEERRARSITVEAPELLDVDVWEAVSESRREAIARVIDQAQDHLSFVGMERYDERELPIAVFEDRTTGWRFSLIPGGLYRRGFSMREEDLVRAVGAERADQPNFDEEYGALLEHAAVMRPVRDVQVEPFLLMQYPLDPQPVAEMGAIINELPYRLPSEAEHEYAQRGLTDGDLCWHGHSVPNEQLFEALNAAGAPVNVFGCGAFGIEPELLTDAWEPTYEGAPVDGTARLGEGPRVSRGGAAMLYPWQACGEWQMLMNASRQPADTWEFGIAARPALGIRVVALV